MWFNKKKQQKEKQLFEEVNWRKSLDPQAAAIIQHHADGILVFNRKGVLSLLNPKAEKLLKVKASSVIGTPLLRLTSFPQLHSLIELLGANIREVSRIDTTLPANRIAEVTSIPMLHKNDRIGSIVILHDVTREKAVEEMKTEFVMIAAHRLRTPISAVKWALKLLLEGDMGKLSAKQKKIIEQAYAANERTVKLINTLLNITKIEEGKYLSRLVLSDIEEVIEGALQNYQDAFKQRKIKTVFQRSQESLPRIMVDRGMMNIALGNLLDNAAHYTLPGGTVTITITGSRQSVVVQITDTGIGIPAHQHEEVFTKFFRGDNASQVYTDGTGLGLFIAKEIIEAHEGKIWFESSSRTGTTFYVSLPIKHRFSEYLTKEFY